MQMTTEMKYLVLLYVAALPFSLAVPQICSQLATSGSCSFYTDCVEMHRPCESEDYRYALDYGLTFCKAFEEHSNSFTHDGRIWIKEVRKCLMKTLLRSDIFINKRNCKQLQAFAFKSHPECYVKNGFCHDIFSNYQNMKAMFWVFYENLSPILRSFQLSMSQIKDTITMCRRQRLSSEDLGDKLKNHQTIAEGELSLLGSVINRAKQFLQSMRDYLEEFIDSLSPDCQTDMDVMFVMDSSGSIGASNFITMKNFVANAIVAFNLTDNSRIGVITFASSPIIRIRLAPVRNVKVLAANVRNIYYTTGGTATDSALRAMLAAFGRGDPDRLRIGILLTDGRSDDALATRRAANVVHSSGIIMYTIGIGRVNLAELATIATHPPGDYSFQISSFAASRFNQLLLPLVSQTCTTPQEKDLGDTYTSRLGKGDSKHINTPFDEKGVTLEFNVKEGGIDVYGSLSVRNPGKATADFSFPVRGEVSYYVSPEYFERVTGIQLDRRSRRQAINQGIRNHTIHLTITGISEKNNFSAVTVADNKVPPAKDIFVRIQQTEYTVGEDDEFVRVYFEAVREVSPGSDVYVVANYTFDFEILVKTINGSATMNADFQPLVGSVNFSAGEQFSTPFIIKINDDIISEGPEHFKVMYNISTDSVPSGATVRQLDVEATVEIVDNDAKIISFQESFQTVAESAGVVELRLVTDNVFEREQFIDLSAVDGTANNDSCIFETDGTSDFSLTSDSVRFPPNSTLSDPFRVQIVDDLKVENQESFSLSFVIPEAASKAGAIYGQIRTLDVLIQDDDGVRVGFEEDSAIGLEGSTVSVKFYKRGCIGKRVRVSMGAKHITASAIDYDIKRFITFLNVTRCSRRKTYKIKLKMDMNRKETAIETFTVFMEKANRRRVGFDQRCVNVSIVDPAISTVSSPP